MDKKILDLFNLQLTKLQYRNNVTKEIHCKIQDRFEQLNLSGI